MLWGVLRYAVRAFMHFTCALWFPVHFPGTSSYKYGIKTKKKLVGKSRRTEEDTNNWINNTGTEYCQYKFIYIQNVLTLEFTCTKIYR